MADIYQEFEYVEFHEVHDLGSLNGEIHEIMQYDGEGELKWDRITINLGGSNKNNSKIDIDEQSEESPIKETYSDKAQSRWINALLKKAREVGELLSNGEHRNKEIVEKAISTINEMPWDKNSIDKTITAGIRSHYEKFKINNDASEYDGSINIKSIFNAMKFHLILRQELLSIDTEFYIDADAQL
ncbi:hypothetical protein GBN32_12015, partial [Plesiomonas shigelloides]|uniref:hypothetical protein n=1 Tax=Plesiomonas shigelloides TaxID=703 RepID=UPI0012620989